MSVPTAETVVWKYTLSVGAHRTVPWPDGARVTHAEAIAGGLAVQFWVHRPSPVEVEREVTFEIVGTGHPIPAGWEIDATAPVPELPLVWHLARRPAGT